MQIVMWYTSGEVGIMAVKYESFNEMMNKFISVSELGRGQASKVIQAVSDEQGQYIVVKNNKPKAIILSVNEYSELLEAKENMELLLTATERMSGYDHNQLISFSDVLEELGISEEELDKLEDDVEIE